MRGSVRGFGNGMFLYGAFRIIRRSSVIRLVPCRWGVARFRACLLGVFGFLSILGCDSGGGSGGGSGPVAQVAATSFLGAPTVMGGPVPATFRNEALLLTMSGTVDPTPFSGFLTAQGSQTPLAFVGKSSVSLSGVPYNAFLDQLAARTAIRIFDDASATAITSVIIGRSLVDPRVLVIDPVVPFGNAFLIPVSSGFAPGAQIDLYVPPGSALRAGGLPVGTFGGLPPQTPPPFSSTPAPATLLVTGANFVPDIAAPFVNDVTTVGLAGGAASTPIQDNDVIRVSFSEPIDANSINLGVNLIVRNLSVQTQAEPNGVLVPVVVTFDVTQSIVFLTPQPSFGPGPYQIRVDVGGQNLSAAAQIKDQPGADPSVQNALGNTLAVTFTTIVNPQAPLALSIIEDFSTNTTQDTAFNGRYNNARWNVQGSGRAEALPISGSAQPGQSLGTRIQFTINPSTPPPVTAFFSPFDAMGTNNLGATVNPNGGSHSQFLYAGNAPELADGITDSIELVEWGAAFTLGSPFPFTFGGFSMRLSHSTANPLGTFGLTSVYSQNYDFDNPQNEFIQPTSHPGNLALNEAPITVVPSSPYVVPTLASMFVPFPSLSTLFDYDDFQRTEISALTNQATQPSLLVDIDIPPPVAVNNNFIFGNFPLSPVPIRRLIAPSGSTLAAVSDNVAAHMRFTFVGRNSSVRSLYYDLGVAATNGDFFSLTTVPSISARPTGTAIIVRAESADGFNGSTPISPSGLRVIHDRAGNFSASNLDLLDGRRYVRFLVEFESNTNTNVSPFLESLSIGYLQ